jgi:hypothetical protein
MAASRHEGDHHFVGSVSMGTLVPSAGSVGNTSIAALAGIDAAKLEHRHQRTYAQPNTAATTETRALHVCYGATGTILAFRAGSIAKAVGDSTVTVDLRKNGSTVLSAVIQLDSGNTNRVVEAGTVNTAGIVAGDLLEVVITATIGTGTLPTGVYCQVVLDEDAQ